MLNNQRVYWSPWSKDVQSSPRLKSSDCSKRSTRTAGIHEETCWRIPISWADTVIYIETIVPISLQWDIYTAYNEHLGNSSSSFGTLHPCGLLPSNPTWQLFDTAIKIELGSNDISAIDGKTTNINKTSRNMNKHWTTPHCQCRFTFPTNITGFQVHVFTRQATDRPKWWAICPVARFWSRRVRAKMLCFGREGAYCAPCRSVFIYGWWNKCEFESIILDITWYNCSC